MYTVTENELNALKDSGTSATVDVALFTLSAGALVTLIVTLTTVQISDPHTFAGYVAATIVCAITGLWFGARSYLAIRGARAKLNEIKGGS